MDNIVIWVWSPIGYETYLSLKRMYADQCDVFMIAARSFQPDNANGSVGAVHHYFEQTSEQVRFAAQQIGAVLTTAAARTGQVTLVVPQMANFWIRSTIESERCNQVYVYDEGRAAYGKTFSEFRSKVWMRGKIRFEKALVDYFKDQLIDGGEMERLYRRGVKFYEMHHRKLSHLLSFFKDAFPGYSSVQLPVDSLRDFQRTDSSGSCLALLLLPPLQAFRDKSLVEGLIRDIEEIKRAKRNVQWVIKNHPSNTDAMVRDLGSMLKIPDFTSFRDFAHRMKINSFREPSFYSFDYFITYENSTKLYLGMLDQLELMEDIEVELSLGEAA